MYNLKNDYLWRTDSGSFNVTGILIFERSFPIFLHNKFHKFTPAVEDIGTGSFILLPVLDNELDLDAVSPTSNQQIKKFAILHIF